MEKETNVNQQVEKGDNLTPTANEVDLQQLMGELDKEQAYRQHGCWRQYITVIVSIFFVAFQLYASLSGRVTAQILRATHLAFVQLLAFLLFPPTKKSPRNKLPWYDIVLGLIGSACWMYVVINFQDLARRTGAFLPQDIIVGVIGILVLMESCRRIVGIPILIIASAFILYAFHGSYLPGFLNHR